MRMFTERLPKGLSPQRAIEHTIDQVPGSRPTACPAYKLSFAEQAGMKLNLPTCAAREQIRSALTQPRCHASAVR